MREHASHRFPLCQKQSPSLWIGLMSGTSMDGVDACAVQLCWPDDADRLRFDIVATVSDPYPPALRDALFALVSNESPGSEPVHPMAALSRLNAEVGEALAHTAGRVMALLADEGLTVEAIASHGQTVWHQPPVASQPGHTLQIGEPAIIVARCGVPVVADFRPSDMAYGGHGAPLVPFAEYCLFGPGSGLACQNIGGVANLTALFDNPTLPVLAFDTGPGNMLMDAVARRWIGQPFDDNGSLARQGFIQEAVLANLLAHPYFELPPPKSTGREQFGAACLSEWLMRYPGISPADWAATLTALTARSIANAYERWVLPRGRVRQVVAGGGGVRNALLMAQLADGLNRLGLTLTTHEAVGIPSQYKEALAFAVLGWAAACGLPNNLPSVTGARKPVIMGKFS